MNSGLKIAMQLSSALPSFMRRECYAVYERPLRRAALQYPISLVNVSSGPEATRRVRPICAGSRHSVRREITPNMIIHENIFLYRNQYCDDHHISYFSQKKSNWMNISATPYVNANDSLLSFSFPEETNVM